MLGLSGMCVFTPNEMEWRCPCRGLESFGIPCTHVLKTVVHLGIHELPSNLICRRWTKNAKEGFEHVDSSDNTSNSSNRCTPFAALQYACKRLCSVACRYIDDFNRVRELVNAETAELLSRGRTNPTDGSNPSVDVDADVGDPVKVRTKGCGPSGLHREHSSKRPRRCTNCREEGHNRRSCPDSQGVHPVSNASYDDSEDEDDFDDGSDVDLGVDFENEGSSC